MTSKGAAWVLAVAGLAGALSMTLELSAVRLIAPWFGTSSVVWTHVIGVVLLALSTGYLLGARLSRSREPERALGVSLLLAAGATAWLPALSHPVASWFHPSAIALDEAAELLRWGSLATALILFLPPTFLLGCVAPLATEILQRGSDRSAGDAGGRVLAISTIGSIAGTFATTYLVLPHFGLTRTYVGVGVLLALTGSWCLARRRRPALGALHLLALPALAAVLASRAREPAVPEGWRLLDHAESAYQSIRVVESTAPGPLTRRLQVNEGLDSFQSVWQTEPGLLPDGYYYNLFALPVGWTERQPTWNVFVAGLGAGTAWRVLEGALPEGVRLIASGAEIDPEVVELGRRRFDLPTGEPDRRVLCGGRRRCSSLLFQFPLQIRKRIMGRGGQLFTRPPSPCGLIRNPRVFVLVAIDAKQLPVAAVEGIVVVVVVLVVDRQFTQPHPGKLAAAAPADVRVQLERPLAIGVLALGAVPARFGYDAVEAGGIGGLGHVCLC